MAVQSPSNQLLLIYDPVLELDVAPVRTQPLMEQEIFSVSVSSLDAGISVTISVNGWDPNYYDVVSYEVLVDGVSIYTGAADSTTHNFTPGPIPCSDSRPTHNHRLDVQQF